jgi:rubrerythrin
MYGFLEINFIKPMNTMRKVISSIIGLLICIFMVVGRVPVPVTTSDNLKAAYNGESTASKKYADYAKKATEEGLNNIAKLFEATSMAESIHANNHKTAFEKMGKTIEAPQIGSYSIKSTAENLEDAINNETYEVDVMYAGFLKTAVKENISSAITTFTWASDTEKKHVDFYKKALAALKSSNEKSLPDTYFVCPKCGNTFDAANVENPCSFCMTGKSKFISF